MYILNGRYSEKVNCSTDNTLFLLSQVFFLCVVRFFISFFSFSVIYNRFHYNFNFIE